jgi:hypothetical protein
MKNNAYSFPVIHHEEREGHEVGFVDDREWKIEDGKCSLRSSILNPPSSGISGCETGGENITVNPKRHQY